MVILLCATILHSLCFARHRGEDREGVDEEDREGVEEEDREGGRG